MGKPAIPRLVFRASATDAMQHGFRPIVVAEACGDRTPAIHDANIADLGAKYADIATIEEVITRFGTLTAN